MRDVWYPEGAEDCPGLSFRSIGPCDRLYDLLSDFVSSPEAESSCCLRVSLLLDSVQVEIRPTVIACAMLREGAGSIGDELHLSSRKIHLMVTAMNTVC